MERKKAVKLITVMLMAVVLTMSLVVTCPSFSITSNAAEDTVTWDVPNNTYAVSTITFSLSNTLSLDSKEIKAQINAYYIGNKIDMEGSVTVTYPSFSCNQKYYCYRGTSLTAGPATSNVFDVLRPYLTDNKGNEYPLNAENGGSISIKDSSGIDTFYLYIKGTVSGDVTFPNQSTKLILYSYIDSLAFTFSHGVPSRTITDSEGTVWTVPDAVKNPVVIKSGSNKKLIDGVTGLGYFVDNVVYDGCFILASETNDLPTIYMYNEDGTRSDSPLQFRQESAEFFGIEPIYCASIPIIDEFLYGFLPEIKVILLQPEPTEPPEPSPEPSPGLLPEPVIPSSDFDTLHDLGSVELDNSDNGGMVDETSVYCSGGRLVFRTKYGDRNYGEYYTPGDPCKVHIEDNCSQFIGRFTLNTQVDGYVSMMFPDLWLYPEIFWPGPQYFVENLDQNDTNPQIMKLFEYAEPIIVLYANGEKYTVSPYGGSVQIPVNKGENIVIMEIVLQVKDDFAIFPAQSFYVTYECNLEDFSVYIREYKDVVTSAVEDIKGTLENQLEESKKQTDALTKYEGADKMQSDNDKLSGAIKDYDDVSDSLFESAGDGINNFDISVGLDFGTHVLASIMFLGTVLTNIIAAMGDFSMLYTVGACMVLVCVLLGLYKFFGGDD